MTCRSVRPFLSMSGAQKVDILCGKTETGFLSHTIPKNQFWVARRSKCEMQNYQAFRSYGRIS